MKTSIAFAAAVLTCLAAGCGSVERLWGGATEQKRVRVGTEYTCDANRKLLVRFDSGGKSAWVIFPEREFRLDQVPGDSGARYSNGRATLSASGEDASLEEGSATTYANCKRSAAK